MGEIEELREQLKKAKEGNKKLSKENKELKCECKKLNEDIKAKDEYIHQLKSEKNNLIEAPRKNERGAGRKPHFTDADKETMKLYKIQGKTLKEIAELYKCSTSYIFKVINENENEKG